MMLVRTGKKTSKFEDPDTVVAKPVRAVFEMPHRTSPRAPPRLKTTRAAAPAAAGSEHHHAVVGAGRGTSPRSPLHEKKPAIGGGGAGAGSRVAELEAKLGKAEGQLADMRDQLAAAEKSRKDARAALVEAKKRFSVKKRDVAVAAASQPIVVGDEAPNAKPVEAEQTAQQVGGDVVEAAVQGEGEEAKETEAADDETNGVAAIVGDLEENKESHEVEHLRTKLMAKDSEVEHLRTKLTTMEAEIYSLRANLTTKDGEINDLKAKLIAKNADLAAVEADNADLMKMAEESAHAAKETAMKAREAELALRERAAREARAAERLRASERAREALEAEMHRGRAQSEQWRKAAEEAAAVLGAVDAVEKQRNRGERMVAKDTGEHLVGNRKGGGGAMRMLSDLWKKKGQK